MIGSHFATNPTTIEITRSRFKRGFNLTTTFNMGKLVPIYLDEYLPGDTFEINAATVIRMTTPLKPIMGNLWAEILFFAVPYRTIWDHWEELQGANKTGPWKQNTTFTVPQIKSPAEGWAEGSLADYMGLPINTPNIQESALPFRAYNKIWNDWFRDENLQNFAYYSTGDETVQGTNNKTNYVTDPITGGMLLPVAKAHDYFTSALPEPQKGPDVLLPLGDSAPIIPTGNFQLIGAKSNQTTYLVSNTAIEPNQNGNTEWYTPKTNTGNTIPGEDFTYKQGLNVDLSQATAATISQLRQAFQIQKMFEKDARGGTRYIEIIKSHFGVTSSDARLQRAEFLGGKIIPISMQQVNQTSATNDTSPQGNTAAFSLTNDASSFVLKSFEEHGIVIGVMLIRQQHTYAQGIEKFWSRKTRTDFYMPVFANISEQPILNKEIFAQGTEEDNEVFGYQEAWADYRYKPNKVTGLMRPNAKNTMAMWNLADYYDELPKLGSDWITEDTTNLDRALAVPSEKTDQFQVDMYFDNYATRPMPVYSIPGLIDHH